MKLPAIVFMALVGSYSLAVAQSSGSGISIVRPTYKTGAADLTTTGANTGPAHGNDKSHPTNALSKTAGNPAIGQTD